MSETDIKNVTFVQCELPPVKSGYYTIKVTQEVNLSDKPYELSRDFVVAGERFKLDISDICPFPPNLANGEYSGVLPHVVFNRRTLPWERSVINEKKVNSEKNVPQAAITPWLAVLLFNEDEAQKLKESTSSDPDKKDETACNSPTNIATFAQGTVKDLVKLGEHIKVTGSGDSNETGTLPEGYLSYPEINPLNYGESPEDKCNYIDIPVDLFNRIAPSKEDLPFLAHVREVDTTHSTDHTEDSVKCSIVLGNRVAGNNGKSCAFLVSLENMGEYLPGPDGTASKKMHAGARFVRLITYFNWSFVTNDMGETFKKLAESLNKPGGKQTVSSLQYPFEGAPPTSVEVKTALDHQAAGNLTDKDARVLLWNGFSMGYLPFEHHLRHGGQTVSWYRGPLVPYPVSETIHLPISCPDEASRYDPQTGMFDVSYSTAWQLGQLLALQNTGYATALYNWKRSVAKADAIKEEMDLIHGIVKRNAVLESFLPKYALAMNKLDESNEPPGVIVDWIAKLSLLNGVPFQYLVPDESMLPPESIRFFYLDPNWIDALIDGGFSIGRAATVTTSPKSMDRAAFRSVQKTRKTGVENDQRLLELVKPNSRIAATKLRKNPRPLILQVDTEDLQVDEKKITGFLLRSQLVSGWPLLNVKGYSDASGKLEIPILRMSKISEDVLLCLFKGIVEKIDLCEPPMMLHSGVEGSAGQYTTTLRRIKSKPGVQFITASLPCRSDKQTLKIWQAAVKIEQELKKEKELNDAITSAEFALEMVKGVVEVEFQRNGKVV